AFVVFSSALCMAQRVWVGEGGVRVRAPFVRVDVYPYGGVSVRAPFAAVDVPPRGYYYEPGYAPPVIFERPVVEPSYPTAADFAAMDAEQLAQALRALSQSLHNRLSRFDTGDTWQRYLRLPDAAIDLSAPPSERTTALVTLLDRFHKVAADPQYSMIVRLPAFTAMESALNEAVLRPETSPAATAAAVEDLPLPAPEQPGGWGRVFDAPEPQRSGASRTPPQAPRNRSFLTPRPRQ
ncbi:MAG: hypothetical protein L0228_21205, partial [Planctomycetes bacterium]|nr:hypothetical protein [Planctomycetota bacterium]